MTSCAQIQEMCILVNQTVEQQYVCGTVCKQIPNNICLFDISLSGRINGKKEIIFYVQKTDTFN